MTMRQDANLEPPGHDGRYIVMEDTVKSTPSNPSTWRRTLFLSTFVPKHACEVGLPASSRNGSRIVDVVVDRPRPPVLWIPSENRATDCSTIPPTEASGPLCDVMGAQATEWVPLQQPDDDEAPGAERWSSWIGTPDITVARAMTFTCSSTNDPSLQARSSRPYAVATRHGSSQGRIRWRWWTSIAPMKWTSTSTHQTRGAATTFVGRAWALGAGDCLHAWVIPTEQMQRGHPGLTRTLSATALSRLKLTSIQM